MQDALRRHFESQFKPLEPRAPAATRVDKVGPAPDEDEFSEWSGLSESSEDGIEIVQVTDNTIAERTSREERKAFMTARPPTVAATAQDKQVQNRKAGKTDSHNDGDAENLKNDLALQRLLQESHLLDPHASLSLAGNNRHKAADLRLQQLGAKGSILTQAKMPMSHRRGIVTKAKEREVTRRRDARENGVILEKAKITKTQKSKTRERGIGNPTVGKFQGGILKLSKRDVADITGIRR